MGYPKIGKTRVEAFSDGVIAIIITIMVLELKVPHTDTLEALVALYPVALSYLLSFVYVAIYWNNHHHLMHTCASVNARILWSNLHLLFWISLVPFATAWMGENHFTSAPTQIYGVVMFFCGFAYYILTQAIIASQGPDSILKKAIGSDWKGKLSLVLYVTAVILGFWIPTVSLLIYFAVAILWIVPDSRIGKLYHA